jgi:4-hydroxybenzoate polyprenyltransferase
LATNKSNTTSNVKFKSLFWFFLASTSLLLTGFYAAEQSDPITLSLLIWCNFLGVFLVYRLNDIIDQNADFSFNIRNFFSYTLHKVVVLQLLFVAIPLVLYFIDPFVFLILAIAAVIGTLYSISFKIGGSIFRLKNVFLVKNILIGVIWGSLVIIGAGQADDPLIHLVFIFASIQVFIGGIIRDIPDLEKDRQSGVKSFPVVIGINATVLFIHFVNLSLLFYCIFQKYDQILLIFIAVPTAWRALNIYLLGLAPKNSNWSQWMNLFTCVLILITFLTLVNYDIINK